MAVLEVEIDAPNNRCLSHPPTGESVRGAFRWHRVKDGNAGQAQTAWGDYVPGQVLGIDLDTGEGYIREPLYDTEHEQLREKIKKKNMMLPPQRKTFKAHIPTWVFWIQRAIEDGLAKPTPKSTQVPDLKTFKEKPNVRFNGVIRRQDDPEKAAESARQKDQIDRLTALVEKQSEQIDRLLEGRKAPGK